MYYIPKIIHYCWFGGNQLPKFAKKCIASWKRYFPNYEIKEWNESNYDVHKIIYIDEAYTAKKYAFVSDYARFDILYHYGGIYFDTDVEVFKSFDGILNQGGFIGIESIGNVAAGLGIGCAARLDIIYQILDFYTRLNFVNIDGSYNLHTVVEYVSAILKKKGLEEKNTIQHLDGLTVYPIDYFCPKSSSGKFEITENTHSIHHYSATWVKKPTRIYIRIRDSSIKIFGFTIGKVLVIPIFIITLFLTDGINGIKRVLYKKIEHTKYKKNI
jgi:hypothetical protein